MGDTVTTTLNNGTGQARSTVVGTGVELPNAGQGSNNLGAAGNTPRWRIDFGANTIRIDFITQIATYGAGSKFTFSSLDPTLPAGCTGTPFISGMTVTTNKPTASFVSSAATFGPHQVVVPFAPTNASIDWNPGDWILVTLQFACDTPPPVVDPCCPPWNSTMLRNMLTYQGTGGINAPYTLRFNPTSAFNGQMQAYINYLHAVNPAITSITITFRLLSDGTGATFTGTGTLVGAPVPLTWTWNGTPPTANFFPPGVMNIGTWYRVDTTIALNNNIHFFPDTCIRSFVDVRLQVLPKPQPGGGGAVLQMRLPNGTVITQPVTTGATPN
jgi:hypothetical protein